MSEISKRKSLFASPLFQLVITRLLEFIREPQAVFWVYFFPLLMAFSLGIAFREKPQEDLRVCIVQMVDETTQKSLGQANGFVFSSVYLIGSFIIENPIVLYIYMEKVCEKFPMVQKR
jgi:hypothetical protein